MPLKKVRKNASASNRAKGIANNMAILTNSNKKLPAGQRRSAEEIKAIALDAAGIKEQKK